jgi:hypothetical protein
MRIPRPSLILLLLYLNNEDPIRGRVRMHNLAFLACRCVPHLREYLDELYTFRQCSRGFFSSMLEDDIELLEEWGLVRVEYDYEVQPDECIPEIDGDGEDLVASPIYSLTDKGRDIVRMKILPILPTELVSRLEELKRKYGRAPVHELLREVQIAETKCSDVKI